MQNNTPEQDPFTHMLNEMYSVMNKHLVDLPGDDAKTVERIRGLRHSMVEFELSLYEEDYYETAYIQACEECGPNSPEFDGRLEMIMDELSDGSDPIYNAFKEGEI